MSIPRYIILGGAGAMGRITVRDLLETAQQESDCEVIVADVDKSRAEALVREFRSHTKGRFRSLAVDIRAPGSAVERFKRGDSAPTIVLNSLQYQLNIEAMRFALSIGAHYVDLGGLFHMTRRQLKLDRDFRRAGLLAVIGMGAAPGITNLLAKRGSEELDEVREIHCRVGSSDRSRYDPKPALAVAYSLQTVLEEFSLPPAVFTAGKWVFVASMSGAVEHRFPAPIGIRYPMHTLHSEVATLPTSFAEKGVRECSFKIAFEPEFTDRVRFLRDLGMASHDPLLLPSGARVAPIEVVNRVAMSQPLARRVGPLRQAEIVRVVLKGTRAGKRVTLYQDLETRGLPAWGIGLDIDTGAPPSVVAQLLVAGKIPFAGVTPPELVVPVAPFFEALRRRKMRLRSRVENGWGLKL